MQTHYRRKHSTHFSLLHQSPHLSQDTPLFLDEGISRSQMYQTKMSLLTFFSAFFWDGFNQKLYRKVILVLGLIIFAIRSVLRVNFSCPILPFSPKTVQFNYFQSVRIIPVNYLEYITFESSKTKLVKQPLFKI